MVAVFNRIASTLTLHAAYNLAAEGKHCDALAAIQKNKRWRKSTTLRLFAVLELSLLNRHQEVLQECPGIIDRLQTKQRRTPDEEYLLFYANWHLALARSIVYPLDWHPPFPEPDASWLSNVSAVWKRTFPLPMSAEQTRHTAG